MKNARFNPILNEPFIDVMNFLNEVPARFPQAISFAPGRPHDGFLNVQSLERFIPDYVNRFSKNLGTSMRDAYSKLGQYGATAGIINDDIAKFALNDFGVDVSPASVVITTGCQEAMLIALSTLCNPATDVLFVSDPCYIGIVGTAKILGIQICPVESDAEGINLLDLEAKITWVTSVNKVPKVIYEIPDFSNPLGSCLSLEKRVALLDIAKRYNLKILEDGTYGLFSFESSIYQPLKSLDRNNSVVYFGSFSKYIYPGLRLGFIISDESTTALFCKIKSFTTINTSMLAQAFVGGFLAEHKFSIKDYIKDRIDFYRNNCNILVDSLREGLRKSVLVESVSWTTPKGGFFVTITLPFAFTNETLLKCAEEYQVIVCPMSYFCLESDRRNQIRLSFSNLKEKDIKEGVGRLCKFILNHAAEKIGAA